MEDKEFEPFEEDFEGRDATYQVRVRGYDDSDAECGYERVAASFKDPEAAIDFAKRYVGRGEYEDEPLPSGVSYVEVSVETVVESDGDQLDVGALFSASFAIGKTRSRNARIAL